MRFTRKMFGILINQENFNLFILKNQSELFSISSCFKIAQKLPKKVLVSKGCSLTKKLLKS